MAYDPNNPYGSTEDVNFDPSNPQYQDWPMPGGPAAVAANPYSGQGAYVSPAMQGTGSGLGDLYAKYYGTSTPDPAAYNANLGNQGGLSAIEKMMQDDPNNVLKKAAAPPPPPGATAAAAPASLDVSSLFSAAPNPLAGRDTGKSDALYNSLQGLFDSGGGFNQDIVNRRTEAAKETLDRQRSSTLKNDRAMLADRGLVGSGPEADALNYLDTNVGNAYKNQVSDIYANESQSADARMMQALQLATGMNENDAANLINSYQAQTARGLGLGNLQIGSTNANNNYTLGLGNLALGNTNAANNYNLGLANFGLQRDLAQAGLDNESISQIQALIDQLSKGAQSSAGGYF